MRQPGNAPRSNWVDEVIAESEKAEFEAEKTQLGVLKTSWAGSTDYLRKCVRLLDVFTDKQGIVYWNSKALN